MKYQVADPILGVEHPFLNSEEITPQDIRQYFPDYLYDSTNLECGRLKYYVLYLAQFFLNLGVRVFLRPRKGEVGDLSREEVHKVYDREARTYDSKHHLTTHGADAIWRRIAAWTVMSVWRQRLGSDRRDDKFEVLDLCTGTGLTMKEIIGQLVEWQIKAEVTGFDFNQKMLVQAAERNMCGGGLVDVRFKRGDAMELYGLERPGVDTGLAQFYANSFDVITLMFDGALKILKPEGHLFVTDMHMPLTSQPGETFFLKWWKMPMLEAMTYWKTTSPLVLARLWGWRDTTRDFYLLPLVTWQDPENQLWGFEIVNFEVESQRWWLNLAIMPVARIRVKKVMITQKEMRSRQAILAWALSFQKNI